MFEKMFSEIESTTTFPEEAYLTIKDNCIVKNIAKSDTFLKAGDKNTILGFLQTGLFRSYFADEGGNLITTSFIEEGNFFTDLNSFPDKSKSERTLEALSDSKV